MSAKPKKNKSTLAEDAKTIAKNAQAAKNRKHETASVEGDNTGQVLTLRSTTVRTLEGALDTGQVDLSIWEVERFLINKWDSAAKLVTSVRDIKEEQLAATELWQVKVWFRRKTAVNLALENLLEQIQNSSPVVPRITRIKLPKASKRALEVCLMDPHLGLQCFTPEADCNYNPEDAVSLFLWSVDRLLSLASSFGPFEEIVLPFGNDLFHVDNIAHTTTKGTAQPEAVSYQHIFPMGIKMQIAAIDKLKEIAPVKAKLVQGNHAYASEFAVAQAIKAYYHNDKNVEVDASCSPFKSWRFGRTLIFFEHGHSVSPIRLAALLANECPEDWAQTTFREVHLADQHRKATSKPSSFEEQGVSIEYLPGLTAPNAWHRQKGFNHQKRGAVAFVYDYETGPIGRLQANIDSSTGLPLGS